MAEYCLECMNKYIVDEDKPLDLCDVTMEDDLCEGCGEWKPCVIEIKKSYNKKYKKNKKWSIF